MNAPISAPTTTPAMITSKLTMRRSVSVTMIAISMPVEPSRLPRTAVRGCDMSLSAQMKRTAANR